MSGSRDACLPDGAPGHYGFFCNRECEFFPCHATDEPDSFNCMFCYCPLYALGKACGGDYLYLENGVKSCERCMLPHRADACRFISARFPALAKLAGEGGRDT